MTDEKSSKNPTAHSISITQRKCRVGIYREKRPSKPKAAREPEPNRLMPDAANWSHTVPYKQEDPKVTRVDVSEVG